MITIFITVAGFVLKCYVPRFCDFVSPEELGYLLRAGFVELMFESTVVPVIKIYRRVRDRKNDEK